MRLRLTRRAVCCASLVLMVSLVMMPGRRAAADEARDAARRTKILSMYQAYKKRQFPTTPDLTAEDVFRIRDEKNFVIVDVREPKEQAVSMIPGAMTAEDYLGRRDEFAGRPVLAYCTIGSRSGRFAQKLTREGVEAYNLIGGVLAWAHAGGVFLNAAGPTNRVHVYGRAWDLLPSVYQAVR